MNSLEEFKYFNKYLPIKIVSLEQIISNICLKCPELTKAEISIIVRCFFETIRYFLILGNFVSINGLFSNMHLLIYKTKNETGYIKKIITKISTPGYFKKYDRI